MQNSVIVPETKILIAVVVYLVKRGVMPYQISIPRGRGIDTYSTKSTLENAFREIGLSISFSTSGADVLALSEKEWWHIECKGAGSGKAQTQRNNFDRALASVVSYYGEETSKLPEKFRNSQQFLGLALPTTDQYMRELSRRVGIALRKQLNLWILLYDTKAKEIKSVEPSQDFTF